MCELVQNCADFSVTRADVASETPDTFSRAISPFVAFPCGIIRGAMQNLGLPCSVTVDTSQLPACASAPRIYCGALCPSLIRHFAAGAFTLRLAQ